MILGDHFTCQDVVESDVLGYGRVVQDQLDVVRTICAQAVPEGQQGVFVVVDRDGRLGQLGVEERPQVVEVNTRALHRTTTPTLPTEDQLLILGAQEVGHGLEVGHQLVGPVLGQVDVVLGVGQQPEQELQEPEKKEKLQVCL